MPMAREIVAVLAAAAACGGGPPPAPDGVAPATTAAQDTTTIPAGYGTLRRDDIVVQFSTSQLQIQVLPLSEDLIRLLRPDAYQALSGLIQSRAEAIASAAARAGVTRPTLVLVTYRGLVPQARFSPEELSISSRGQVFRPAGVVPLSTAWDTYQLEARQQAMAVYLFPEGISFRERLLMGYETLTSDSWSRSLSLVERERAAVLMRSQASEAPAPAAADTAP